jgi:pectate disaccharide-lyase
MKIIDLVYGTIFMAATSAQAAFYVSPIGDDGKSGAIDQPFLTIAKAVTLVTSGDTIVVRGGTYSYSSTIKLAKTGTAMQRFYILAYPNEHPILDFSVMADSDSNRGFFLTGNYWHIKGLEVCNAGDNGIKIEGSYNIIEQCIFHHNKDSGLQIGLSKDFETNPGDIAAYNEVINCDSHNNTDAPKGANADGFACKLCAGKGNSFKGCRSWENSDDGWDLYQDEYQVIIEDCWTWHNGDPAVAGNLADWGGNGNGFKLGGNSSYSAPHIARRCVVFDHNYGNSNCKGFDQNDNQDGITLYNCVSWANRYNYALNNDLPENGGENHIVKNCVAFNPMLKDYSFCSNTIQSNNSWDITGVSASADDFISIDVALAKAPRQTDGSLPNNGFAKLKQGSDLIDKGVDVGLPFNGAAPDLGAYETGATITNKTVQARFADGLAANKNSFTIIDIAGRSIGYNFTGNSAMTFHGSGVFIIEGKKICAVDHLSSAKQ